ncbi:MAG: DUF1579 domain-containing protein [Chitinophagaceae bacterium]|nr:MAG: DUF1579 domain-containing protein [Chitinophagaceae bacterium]
MKKLSLMAMTVLTVMVSCNNETAVKTESKSTADSGVAEVPAGTAKKEWVAVDSATMTKKWMENAAVGKEHEGLAKSDGKWVGKSTSWMAKGAPPMVSDVKMENRMILGGRFQESNYSGDMAGMAFAGRSIMGYDNYKKKYVATMMDNMGTGSYTMEGDYDAATKTYKLAGSYTNPVNGSNCEMKQHYQLVDDNTELMEMWGPDPATGEQFKTMEIKFTRVK